MRSVRWLIAPALVAGLGLGALPARQDEKTPPPDAPPAKFTAEAGQRLPGPFRSYIVAGTKVPVKPKPDRKLTEAEENLLDAGRAGKMHCLVCDRDQNPTVAVFAREVPGDENAPLPTLLKKLEELSKTYSVQKFGGFAVFLTLKDDFLKDESRFGQIDAIKRLGETLNLDKVSLGLDLLKSPQTDAYAIPEDAQVFVLFYDRFQVKNVWSRTAANALSADDVTEIVSAVEKAMPPARKKK